MDTRNQTLIDSLLARLDLKSSLFHVGEYCDGWKASTAGRGRASFHIVLTGECWLHLPDEAAPVSLRQGDAVFFLRDIPHVLSDQADPAGVSALGPKAMQPMSNAGHGTGLACGFFQFSGPSTAFLLEALPDHIVLKADGDPVADSIQLLFQLVLAEARRSGPDTPSPLLARLVDVLFFYAIRHVVETSSIAQGVWGLLQEPRFYPLLEALLTQPGHDWSVETMATTAHMSRATFFRRFTQLTGMPPAQLVAQVRMHLAERLIAKGLSMADVAEHVGYQSDAAFMRAFRKITGVAPGRLRATAGRITSH